MDEFTDKQNLSGGEKDIKSVAGDKNSDGNALAEIKHCQICQSYKSDLKPVSGQMACANCRNKARVKQLAKAQISFFDDQPPLFRL